MRIQDILMKGINGEKHGEPNHHVQRAIGLGKMGIPNQLKHVAVFVTLTAAGMAAVAA